MSTADPRSRVEHLADFQVGPRVLLVAAMAVPVGAAAAGTAWCLLRLIGLCTHAVFAQDFGTSLIAPGSTDPPWWLVLLAPVAGGLVIGLMARYGSERIRGHGMPETIEVIVAGGSRVAPKVALLKPVSAAISIGSGGPFGAEGPIIMTGGAVGSIFAQHWHLSADERKALLVAGAVAGMCAVFNAPMASVLLAVELLLFEWRARSIIPVAVAVTVAAVLRVPLLGGDPVFAVHVPGDLHIAGGIDLLAVAVGSAGGLLAIAVTGLVYASEDRFARLPLHWMWWPAIGGAIIGVGGLIEPRALGVGYDVIEELLSGHAPLSLVVGILVVKSLIWGLSLGSGTSGGVVAPILMIGAAMGALLSHVLPGVTDGFWPMVGLAAVVGGVMRCPLTGTIFPLELTHAWPVAFPLLAASFAGYAVSVFVLDRSILTERIARRGLHLSREYAVDPLEVLLVDEVMDAGAAPASTRVVVYGDDTLRTVAGRMAVLGCTDAAVVDRADPDRVLGAVTLEMLLEARARDVASERDRERPLAALRPRVVRRTV